jgi:3-dehydroquinate synthase
VRSIRVNLGNRSYDIRIGYSLLNQSGKLLKELGFGERVVIITDSRVRGLYSESLKQNLVKEQFQVNVLDIPEGEEQKSFNNAGKLFRELAEVFTERTTPILALGGGVIGDLTGFVAATYMRGVPLIQVPTTLLAQVDSSIGGKVAVDHGQLKNMIGAFYQPRLVIIDIATLKTLTRGEVTNGLAEIIKSAVIQDKELFSYLEDNLEEIQSYEESVLEQVVFKTARIKSGIVELDESDLGLRNILNFGHTVGHAIETTSDFVISHGHAISIGMVVASRISNSMGIFNDRELSQLVSLLEKAGLPTNLPDLPIKGIIRAMEHDKKIVAGKVRFILPRKIGEVFITEEVDHALLTSILETAK